MGVGSNPRENLPPPTPTPTHAICPQISIYSLIDEYQLQHQESANLHIICIWLQIFENAWFSRNLLGAKELTVYYSTTCDIILFMVAIKIMSTMVALYVHHYTPCRLINTQGINQKLVKNKGKSGLHWSVKII